MSLERFNSLLYKSARIQSHIEIEEKRALPDTIKLLKLKKIRLFLKDKMAMMAKKVVAIKTDGISKTYVIPQHYNHSTVRA